MEGGVWQRYLWLTEGFVERVAYSGPNATMGGLPK